MAKFGGEEAPLTVSQGKKARRVRLDESIFASVCMKKIDHRTWDILSGIEVPNQPPRAISTYLLYIA